MSRLALNKQPDHSCTGARGSGFILAPLLLALVLGTNPVQAITRRGGVLATAKRRRESCNVHWHQGRPLRMTCMGQS